jgi:hypothetical protein
MGYLALFLSLYICFRLPVSASVFLGNFLFLLPFVPVPASVSASVCLAALFCLCFSVSQCLPLFLLLFFVSAPSSVSASVCLLPSSLSVSICIDDAFVEAAPEAGDGRVRHQ